MRGRSPLLRQWMLLEALSSRAGGATVLELVRELGVSEKTVRRDLGTFQKVGFPLQEHFGPHGRKAWRLEPSADTPSLSFAFDEAIALYLGRRLLEPLAGTVNRMEQAAVIEFPFERPDDFDLQEHLAKSFGGCIKAAGKARFLSRSASPQPLPATSANRAGTQARNSHPKKTATS